MPSDLDFAETCEHLGVCEATLRKMVRDDDIPYYRVRKELRFEPHRLAAWKAAGGTDAARRDRDRARRRRRVAQAGPTTTAERRRDRQAPPPARGHGSLSAWAHLISRNEDVA